MILRIVRSSTVYKSLGKRGRCRRVFVRLSEQERYAPYRCKPYHCVDYSRGKRSLSSADPCHDVKFEESYRAPVDAADDGDYQSYSVKHYDLPFFRADFSDPVEDSVDKTAPFYAMTGKFFTAIKCDRKIAPHGCIIDLSRG